jgi:hypothetical protein
MIKGRDLRYFALGAIIVASGLSVWAAVSIPNTFVAGTPIKSAEVNANFSSLKAFVDALETNKQTRVAATCAAGSSIRAIATDGTVTCQADNGGPGGVVYTAGAGLTLAGSEFSVNTTVIQSRVTGTCAAGAISAIAANGTVTCAPAGSLSVPASLIGDSGVDGTPALYVRNTRPQSTSIFGESTTSGSGVFAKSGNGQALYGWTVSGGEGVYGTAPTGIGVHAVSASGTALQVDGPIKVGGSNKAAFKHIVTAGGGENTVCGSSSNYSRIESAISNNDANALIFLTPTEASPTNVSVRYNPVGVSGCAANKWFVYRSTGSFTGSETYNVLIIKQ